MDVVPSEDSPSPSLLPGTHECEWTTEADAEAALQGLYDNCEKNPGHKSFIPIGQFNEYHLPRGFQDKDILKWVRAGGDLTVKLIVKSTSLLRPETYPRDVRANIKPGYFNKVGTPYPFYEQRGTGNTRSGTGWVYSVCRADKEPSALEGPCKCEAGCDRTDVGEVRIQTACHLIFDSSEARTTEVRLFDDGDGGVEETAMGQEVVSNRTAGDWTCFKVLTHNQDLLDRLEAAIKRFMELRKVLYNRYIHALSCCNFIICQRRRPQPFPTIITSHPHGQSKMVTVGQDLGEQRLKGDMEKSVRLYDTCTCPGSSGAPVWSLRKCRLLTVHPHIESVQKGINRSGVGEI